MRRHHPAVYAEPMSTASNDEALRKAYSEGQEAGDKGKSLSTNPYPSDTNRQEHDEWTKGWDDGRRNH